MKLYLQFKKSNTVLRRKRLHDIFNLYTIYDAKCNWGTILVYNYFHQFLYLLRIVSIVAGKRSVEYQYLTEVSNQCNFVFNPIDKIMRRMTSAVLYKNLLEQCPRHHKIATQDNSDSVSDNDLILSYIIGRQVNCRLRQWPRG